MGGFNFRLGTYNVPEGPSANPYGEARRAEFQLAAFGGRKFLKIIVKCLYVGSLSKELWTA